MTPPARVEYRCVTVFDDFSNYNYNAQKMETLRDYRNYSLSCRTREEAESSAAGMRRLHGPEAVARNPRTPTIKRQIIQQRVISDWEDML